MTEPTTAKPPRSQETQIAVLEVQMTNLDRGMKELGVSLGVSIANLEKKLDTMSTKFEAEYVQRAELDNLGEQVKSLKETVAGMKEGISWVIKIVLGAVILAALGLVLAKGGISAPPH